MEIVHPPEPDVIVVRPATLFAFIKVFPFIILEIMMNETTPFRRKLTHCFGAN